MRVLHPILAAPPFILAPSEMRTLAPIFGPRARDPFHGTIVSSKQSGSHTELQRTASTRQYATSA